MAMPANAEIEEHDTDILDVMIIFAQYKRWVIGCVIGFAVIGGITSTRIAPTYTATAQIMPPQQQGSSLSAMLGQLGSLAGAAGGAAGLKSPNDLYVGMLQSRTVEDDLIKRFGLLKRYSAKTWVDGRMKLAKATAVAAGKDGLLSISVRDQDPSFAADLANAYVDELKQLNQNLAITDAAKRRLFFEQQLKVARDRLANAEIALANTQRRTGLLQPDGQIKALITSAAQLRGEIANKEVELAGMRTFATEQNPDYIRVEKQITALKGELDQLGHSSQENGDVMLSGREIPESGLDYLRRMRDVKYEETIFEVLAKQFETAKMDEARDASLIQVLDVAMPPDKRSDPGRTTIVLLGAIAGLIVGLVGAIVREFYLRSRESDLRQRWRALSLAWKGGYRRYSPP